MTKRALADALYLVRASGALEPDPNKAGEQGLRIMRVGDSLELVRRVDFGLGLIELVDRETFDALSNALPRADRVAAFKDPETGFVRVDARLARTGVLQYADREGNVWGELVDEDELFDPESMRSFEMLVLTEDDRGGHPEEFVSTSNVKDYQVGHVGTDVRRDGRYLRASVLITDADTIKRVEDGKAELSCGYTASARLERGIRDGAQYTYRQLRRRGNHVSIVDRGRAGPSCRLLLDSTSATATWKDSMDKTKKIKIDGIEVELPIEIADAIEAARKSKTRAVKVGDSEYLLPVEVADKLDAMSFGGSEEEEETEDSVSTSTSTARDSIEYLRGKNDALEAKIKELQSGEGQRIDARVSLVQTANRILGSEFKTDGLSSAAIKVAIVNKVQPDRKIDARPTGKGAARSLEFWSGDTRVSDGYLDGRFEGAVEIFDQTEDTAEGNAGSIFRAMQGHSDSDLDPIPTEADVIKIVDNYHRIRTRRPDRRAGAQE